MEGADARRGRQCHGRISRVWPADWPSCAEAEDLQVAYPTGVQEGTHPLEDAADVAFSVAKLIRAERLEMQRLLAIDEQPPQPTRREAFVMNKVLETD